MAAPVVVEERSVLPAPAGQVWAVVSTMAGVNAELGPWVRMTHPADVTSLAAARDQGRALEFGSWLLALGVVPFDRHALRLEQVIDPPGPDGAYGFEEESTSWLQRRWRHERRVTPTGDGGCIVADRVTVVPRLGLARPLAARIVPAIFRHRHRRLRARFAAR